MLVYALLQIINHFGSQSKTSLILTKSIEKCTNIYNIKLVLFNSPCNVLESELIWYYSIGANVYFYKLGQS